MPNIIDVAEINTLYDIAERLDAHGLSMTSTQLRSFISANLRPLSQLDSPKAAMFGAEQEKYSTLRCGIEGCSNEQKVLYNVEREFNTPIWRCREHLPTDIIRPGLSHPKVRDSMIASAWRSYFKREEEEEEKAQGT